MRPPGLGQACERTYLNLMQNRTLSRLLWATFVAAFVVLAVQFNDGLEMLFSGRGKLEVIEEPGLVVLRWRGGVEAPMLARLDEAFRKHGADQPRFVLSLHSPGGKLDHGRDVIRLIQRVRLTHAVDTIVEGRNGCASMCVPIYLAGRQRTASPRARFMFHEVSFRDAESEKISSVPSQAIARATDQMLDRYFRPAGVSEAWLADLRGKMKGRDVWRTAEELLTERSGIVHRIE